MDADTTRLKKQLETHTMIKNEVQSQCKRREEILNNQIEQLSSQNKQLKTHICVLDQYIAKLSLLHSQVTASSSYVLSKEDILEISRIVKNL